MFTFLKKLLLAPWSCEARHFVPLYVPTCSVMTIKLNLNLNLLLLYVDALKIHFTFYMFYTVLNCTTRQVTATVFLNDLNAGNNTGLVQESTDHGRHFQAHTTICPSHLNLEAQQKQGQRHRTATEHRHKRHISTRRLAHCDSARWREKKEGKSSIDQSCMSHPPHLASIHSQALVT